MKHAREDYDRIQDPAGLIPPDEPVLLIRGQDQAAIPAARAWIEAHLNAGGDPTMADLIEGQIDLIREWQEERRKVADLPS